MDGLLLFGSEFNVDFSVRYLFGGRISSPSAKSSKSTAVSPYSFASQMKARYIPLGYFEQFQGKSKKM